MSCQSWTDQKIEDLARCNAGNAKSVLGEWLDVDPDEHAVEWIPQRWERRVNVTALLERLGPDGTIRRRDLFDLADRVATGGGHQDTEALLIGIVAWGSGRGLRHLGVPDGDARGPWRAQRALSVPTRPAAIARIRRAVSTTRRDGGWAGYAALSYGGPAHLAAMGESFFTKLIYASGYRAIATPRPLPLILDTNVRKALVRNGGILQGEEWWLNYAPQAYRQYLLIAQTWAELWGIRSDAVEYALFQFGKSL